MEPGVSIFKEVIAVIVNLDTVAKTAKKVTKFFSFPSF